MSIHGDDMAQLQVNRSAFSYPAADRFAGIAGCLIFALFCSVAFALLYEEQGERSLERISTIIISLCGTLFMLLVSVGTYLRTTPIEFNEIGIIRRTVFGVWRQIRWGDVKRIEIWQATPLASIGEKPITQYFIVAASGFHFPYAPNGPIFFTSQIQEHEALLKVLNSYVNRFDIAVIDKRPGANGARLQQVE